MRKQTKLVAVLSAAALFAIGASMTSFAANKGWTQEDDTWVYLNSSGERVTEEWKRSGSNYYWLDENGEMAKNQVVESNDNYYYVNEDGVRLANQWVSVENEDGETVDGKEVDVLWYYLGTTGRAYKSDDPDMLKTSLINGKRYFFDENAHMVSGWTTTMDTSGSKEFTYYLGDENEGWAYTGWQFLEIPEEIQGEYDVDEAWFNFQSSGKARKSTRAYISNAYYSFDDNGVMLDDWVEGTSTTTLASPENIKLNTDDAKSFYNLESGNQGTGWVHTYQSEDEGGDEKWFYLESSKFNQVYNYNGKDAKTAATAQKFVSGSQEDGDALTKIAAKVIKGKTYLFNNKGEMVTGVYKFSDKVSCSGGQSLEPGYYYFSKKGGSAEGRMEKGRTAIDYDGETYTYYFTQNGKACVNQVNDGAVYDQYGVRVEAKDGNANQTYQISAITGGAPLKVNANLSYNDGTIVVSSTGKIRTGSVIIDDVRYVIKNYVVETAYDRHDAEKNDLSDMYVPAEKVE